MISISHSPNSTVKQQILALSYLILPWKWLKIRKGKHSHILERRLAQMHQKKYAYTLRNGRSCLSVILKAMGIGAGDEVIIQAFTCIVIPNAIIWSGAKPVYIDIDETLNINPNLIEQKICSKTKAIIVQHAFGNPANLKQLQKICKKFNLYLIEDCALSLGAQYERKYVGSFGDASFFSFGRDKVISSINGGAIITSNTHISDKIEKQLQNSVSANIWGIVQDLLHAVMMPILSYYYVLGKFIIFVLQKIQVFSKVYTEKEKSSVYASSSYINMPNALADLALQQLIDNLDDFNSKRVKIAQIYTNILKKLKTQKIQHNTDPIFLRYIILVNNPKLILNKAKKKGFLIGNWYNSVIMPKPEHPEKLYYKSSTCPFAEQISHLCINLPTNHKITAKKAAKLANLIKKYAK